MTYMYVRIKKIADDTLKQLTSRFTLNVYKLYGNWI